jgi:hypothetical protein
MARSTQTMHLSCVKISTISKQNEMSFHLNHVTWDYHQVCLMISEPMVRLAQIMHLSCTDSNTVSRKKGVRFHMTHVS